LPERQLVFLTAIQLKIAGSVFSIFSSAIENCRFILCKNSKLNCKTWSQGKPKFLKY